MGGGDDSWARSSSRKKRRSSVASGGVGGGQEGATGPEDICNIVDEGTLRSPDPKVVRLLSVNDRLTVRHRKIRGASILVATLEDGAVAGTIDCSHSDAIITCIAGGNMYTATIFKIHSGIVAFSIRREVSP
jgi:hypothetical protein